VSLEVHPFSVDLTRAVQLVGEALRATADADDGALEYLPTVERGIRRGTVPGCLLVEGDRPVGLATWEAPGPLGLTVRLIFLVPAVATVRKYQAALAALEQARGPIVFLPGRLAGISTEEAAQLLRGAGFAPYSRSEMSIPDSARLPPARLPDRWRVRYYTSADREGAARVHAAAYDGRFDRYLFLEELDPNKDAQSALRDLENGRWGEFFPWASAVVQDPTGTIAGVTIVVRTPRGALIADVAVDPAAQGRGVAGSAIAATVGALRAHRVSPIRLVVTEGNRRAVRLYEKLGFTRVGPPTQEWYHTTRIPAAPEDG
jgi:ribosomal protein S18 acetylase RimI-like enzyme